MALGVGKTGEIDLEIENADDEKKESTAQKISAFGLTAALLFGFLD